MGKESTYAKEQGGNPMLLHRYSAEDVADVCHDGTIVKEGGGGCGMHFEMNDAGF